jgi:hypothetical protein
LSQHLHLHDGVNTVHNEKEVENSRKSFFIIKNSARDGPEGQSKKADSAMCNAGHPPYSEAFLSAPKSNKVSMKKRKEKKKSQELTRVAGNL